MPSNWYVPQEKRTNCGIEYSDRSSLININKRTKKTYENMSAYSYKDKHLFVHGGTGTIHIFF